MLIGIVAVGAAAYWLWQKRRNKIFANADSKSQWITNCGTCKEYCSRATNKMYCCKVNCASNCCTSTNFPK